MSQLIEHKRKISFGKLTESNTCLQALVDNFQPKLSKQKAAKLFGAKSA
jgi:hypothetical protein